MNSNKINKWITLIVALIVAALLYIDSTTGLSPDFKILFKFMLVILLAVNLINSTASIRQTNLQKRGVDPFKRRGKNYYGFYIALAGACLVLGAVADYLPFGKMLFVGMGLGVMIGGVMFHSLMHRSSTVS